MSGNRDDQFSHEKLEAYVVAREFLAVAQVMIGELPRGERDIADQLARAASSVLLNTAEGAGRRRGGEKARFYDIARGSATECAAIVDVLGLRGLASAENALRGRELVLRAVKLLAGLARSARRRGD